MVSLTRGEEQNEISTDVIKSLLKTEDTKCSSQVFVERDRTQGAIYYICIIVKFVHNRLLLC